MLAAVLTAAGCSAPTRTTAVPAAAATSSAAGGSSTLPALPATPAPLTTSATPVPVRLQVPAIGVDTALEGLGLLADGSLASPSTFPEAGWSQAGVRPGDPGPAIVAGHIDSYQGPAVFYDLGKLRAGDTATVTRSDGSTVTFTVESSAQYAKSNFPTADVYGPTPTPELRLITCTGRFDRGARSYDDNLVVTAVATG